MKSAHSTSVECPVTGSGSSANNATAARSSTGTVSLARTDRMARTNDANARPATNTSALPAPTFDT